MCFMQIQTVHNIKLLMTSYLFSYKNIKYQNCFDRSLIFYSGLNII